MSDKQLIGVMVVDPTQPGLFRRASRKERAQFHRVTCSCETCPLLKNRQCVMIGLMAPSCPYGQVVTEAGPTARAGSFLSWLSERKSIEKLVGWLTRAPDKLAFIGDYVYLPYTHMRGNKQVPWRGAFLKREDWTIETIRSIVTFVPRAIWTGDVISEYQSSQIPTFVQHIREVDYEMWKLITSEFPEFEQKTVVVGRMAVIKTLKPNIFIRIDKHRSYPVDWHWDGEKLTTKSKSAYNETWGGIPAGKIELSMIPGDSDSVIVQDASWVSEATVFID